MENFKMDEIIRIELVRGGFIITLIAEDGEHHREVHVSPRKLINRVKELIATRGLVADEKAE